MTAPVVIRHGVRTTTFVLDGTALVPVSIEDDFGPRSGITTLGPEYVSPEAVREAEAQVAVVLRYGVAGGRQAR